MIVIEIGMDWTSPNGRKIVLRKGDITRIAMGAVANAVATGAGNLPAKHVFHAVGPVYRDGPWRSGIAGRLLP